MSVLAISLIVFFFAFGAALLGIGLHAKLPDRHFDAGSKDVVRLVLGLISTMAALVLGLLIASANSSYNTQSSQLQLLGATVVEIDRLLAHYGPETAKARNQLRQTLLATDQLVWSAKGVDPRSLDPLRLKNESDRFYDLVQNLSPNSDTQRFARDQALRLSASVVQTRSIMFEQIGGALSAPFLIVLVFWLVVLFLGYGLFARATSIVVAALLVGALSVAGALFLVLELSSPYEGLIRLSDSPLRHALVQLGS